MDLWTLCKESVVGKEGEGIEKTRRCNLRRGEGDAGLCVETTALGRNDLSEEGASPLMELNL